MYPSFRGYPARGFRLCATSKTIFLFFFMILPLLCWASRGKGGSQEEDGLEFGRFDLDFAVDVLECVYEQELQRRCACLFCVTAVPPCLESLFPTASLRPSPAIYLLCCTWCTTSSSLTRLALQPVRGFVFDFHVCKRPRHCGRLPKSTCLQPTLKIFNPCVPQW